MKRLSGKQKIPLMCESIVNVVIDFCHYVSYQLGSYTRPQMGRNVDNSIFFARRWNFLLYMFGNIQCWCDSLRMLFIYNSNKRSLIVLGIKCTKIIVHFFSILNSSNFKIRLLLIKTHSDSLIFML